VSDVSSSQIRESRVPSRTSVEQPPLLRRSKSNQAGPFDQLWGVESWKLESENHRGKSNREKARHHPIVSLCSLVVILPSLSTI
jgi:hypothetical protein